MARRKKTHEEFVSEVHSLVGDEFAVLGRYESKKEKVKIRHNDENCNYYSFSVTPNDFLSKGTRCPKCSGRVNKDTSYFKNEVFELVGSEYEVLSEYVNSKTIITFKHNSMECGHYKFKMSPNSFLQGRRCHKCNGVARKNTEIFKEEAFELVHDEYTILSTYINARTKIKIRHNNSSCGYCEFAMSPDSFLQGHRCPSCKSSKGERKIKNMLDNCNVEFETQVRFVDCKDKGRLPFDFAVYDNQKNLVCLLEYDGIQHFEPVEFWGGTLGFE